MSYLRFGAMIATSTVVMFVLMYLNTYALEHVFYSETRVYMAFLMGACMAVIMLGFMLGMYQNMKINIAIFVASAIVIGLSLWLVRSQATVSGVSYMRAMIPHHSIAILTSNRAQITDPRVRKLADEIIDAQEREIAEMRYLVRHLTAQQSAMQPEIMKEEPAKVVPVSEALSHAVIPKLDPEPMKAAEIDNVVGTGPGCEFRYTATGKPILVARAPAGGTGAAEGVTKLNGELIALRASKAAGFEGLLAGPTMVAEGIQMAVQHVPDEEPASKNGKRYWEADLVFKLEQGLTVGYGGYYFCDA